MDDNLSDNLCNAIERKDLKKVIDLISEGANVNACDHSGMFPLQIAVIKESKEIIEELIDKGADVDIEVHNKKLVEYAMAESNEDIVKLLVDKGATIKFHDNNEENILRYLIKNGMLKLLQCVIKEIDINFQTGDGHTLLIMAAEQGQLEIVKFLCNMGINVNARSSRNSTALHFAIGNSSDPKLEIVQFLIDNGAEIDVENVFGYTPLQNALYNKNFEVAKLLIENGADVNRIYINTHYARQRLGGTLLHWACRNYDGDEAIKFLVKNGANINATEHDGRTPLCLLVKHNGTPEMIKFLVENGAYLKNTGGGSPLYWAIYNRNIQLQILLIELGTDVNGIIDSHDDFKAPLHLTHDVSVAKLLIDKGANVNIKDKYGCTPLHSVYKISVVKCLVENGADIHAKNNNGETPLHRNSNFPIVKYLIEKGADVNISNKNGYTPLHFAKNVIIARHLIEHGANVKAVTKDEGTVLHSIIKAYSCFDISFEDMSNLINFFLKKGIDVNVTDNYGYTPLHFSAKENNEFAAIVLLANGANISATNIVNQKPIDFGYMLPPLIANIEKMFDAVKENKPWKNIESLLIHRTRCYNITLNDFKRSILHYMVMENNERMVENLFKTLTYRRNIINCITKYNLVNARDKKQWMPLHYAVKQGNETIVKYLLNNGAIYNDDVFNKPILFTDNLEINNILELTEKLFEYIKLGDETKVADCIRIQKEIINARQNNGNTPLHVAIYYDHINIVKLLLNSSADFLVINDTRDTLLHFATVKGYEYIIKTVLEKATKLHDIVNIENVNGMTALHLAAQHNSMKIVQLLLSYGAIYNAKNEDGQMPIDLSTDQDIINYFKFIHELFEDAYYGRTEIINKLQHLNNDDGYAMKQLRNRQMYTLKDILQFNQYDNIVAEFSKLFSVKSEIKKDISKTTEQNGYFSDSDEDDFPCFGLFD